MKTLIQQFDDRLVDLAWSLWTELGVAGTQRKHKDCLIGLEELIILTAVIAEIDPRLRDEALDWCSRYHHFVSISRIRTLVKILGESVHLPFSVFAKTLNSITQSNWPIFSNANPVNLKLSGKSSPPHCEAPALLGLRLRALFGVGARADLLTFFLTQNETILTAADAVEIGYSKRSLADLLDHLVQSGLLVTSVIRNQRKYELVMKEQLKKLVGELPKVAPPWRRILGMLISLRTSLQQFEKNSTATNVVVIRNTLLHIKDLLPSIISSSPPLQSDLNQYLESFTKWLLDILNSFVHGNFRGDFEVINDFEKTIFSLMQDLYSVDDCLDGIDFIIRYAKENLAKHSEIFKENYQLCLSYINELDIALKKLLNFPFHQLMDVKLSDIPYNFSKDKLPLILKLISEFPPVNFITHPRLALKQYEILQVELNKLQEFMNEFKDQLKKIYFLKTNVNLLTLSPELHKRHLVIKLFSS